MRKLPATNPESGYAALISAIIISLLLVTITVALNFVSFFGRFNILDSEFKETSVGLAEACADTAMLEIVKGNIPTPETPINVGSNSCTIVSVTGTAPYIIRTQGEYENSYTNLEISFTFTPPNSMVIGSWKECLNFDFNPCP